MKRVVMCLALVVAGCSQAHGSSDGAAADAHDDDILPGVPRSRRIVELSEEEWAAYCELVGEYWYGPGSTQERLDCPSNMDGFLYFSVDNCIARGRIAVPADCRTTVGAIHDCYFERADLCRAGRGDELPESCGDAMC